MADVKIKPVDGVQVEWTKSSFHKEGSTSIVHREQAKKLVASGKAKIIKGGETQTKTVSEEGFNV